MADSASTGLSWGDFVALVGAAAWLPHVWRFLQKPVVTPIVGGQIELGFSHLGPIFNPKVAFRAERRDALVTGIQYRVEHERGQVADFRCVGLVEYGGRTESTSGEKAFHQRQQDVVALVLTPMAIVERKTLTREVRCIDRAEALDIGLGRAISRLRTPDAAWVEQLIRAPEYSEYHRFLDQAFFWQPGNYQVQCSVSVAGQREPSSCTFRFILGEPAVALLRSNFPIVERNFRRGLGVDPSDGKTEDLHWVYPYALVS